MTRGRHIIRRNGVYAVRFRIPVDLSARIGVAEFQRSLNTRDPREARRRGQLVITWFWDELERLRQMEAPTRENFEAAARLFFNSEVSQRPPLPYPLPVDFAYRNTPRIGVAEEALVDVRSMLRDVSFDGVVRQTAAKMLGSAGIDLSSLDPGLAQLAEHFAARAMAETIRFDIHQMTTGESDYAPEDGLFQAEDVVATPQLVAVPQEVSPEGPRLGGAVSDFLKWKQSKGVGPSSVAETQRVLRWLCEEMGPELQLVAIGKVQLRTFRQDLTRMAVGHQGRARPFAKRLTDDPNQAIKAATYSKYWASVQEFFAWCGSELDLQPNPCADLLAPKVKGEEPRTPTPFSDDEVRRYLNGALFQGRFSAKRYMAAGEVQLRDGHWWAPILLMHTGMRAGELCQLLPTDFRFDADIPHLKVRKTDDSGKATKSVKNKTSVRDVPLHPDMITLGLRSFVERQAKLRPGERVFACFRLGGPGKFTDGITQFSRRYLQALKLHAPGRANHVWRHTFVDRLRSAGCADEEIGALVGHSAGTMTSKYGGEFPLSRKRDALLKLSFGFNLVEFLGGAFDQKRHGA